MGRHAVDHADRMRGSLHRELELLWQQTLGDPAVCVAVLDGPVDLNHPCFAGADLQIVSSPGAAAPQPGGLASLHGTHVASLLFGRHGSSVQGLCPGCRGVIIPVFSEDGDGGIVPCSQLDLARAVTRAVSAGANIINISGGEPEPSGQAERYLTKAIELCRRSGVLVVSAAGNDGWACPHVPAALPNVLVVGATDDKGRPLPSSNWGAAYRFQGILAWGEGLVGATPGGGTMPLTGTSFATAVVSGVAALLMSLQRKTGRPVDADSVRRALLAGAQPCDASLAAECERHLAGRLDIRGAFLQLWKGNPEMSEHNHPAESLPSARPENRVESFLENGHSPAVENRLSQLEVPPPPGPTPPRRLVEPVPNAVQDKPAETRAGSCTCGCQGKKARQLIYALGQIDYDFGSEANRDSFIQQGLSNPEDPAEMLAHLREQPWGAASLIWTLTHETTAVYAIQPAGPFAREAYDRLQEFLRGQLEEGVSQVSLAGVEAGQATLMNGQTVPAVAPELRAMYSWSTPALVKAVLGDRPEHDGERYDQEAEEIANFLDRVYYEINNLGVASAERAINYSATNAFQVATVYQRAIRERMKLDAVSAERSRVCRPGADCWDVKLTFFDPARRQERAKVVHRFTVDVSEVVPVTVGKVRSWEAF